MISDRHRRVIGIDPGLAKVGWGVIEDSGPGYQSLDYGLVRTEASAPHAERLKTIFVELQRVIEKYQPDIFAIEEVFQGKNPRSALLAGAGRSACILAGVTQDLQVVEYPATVVKVAVTGNGRAAKVQVQSMVARILGLAEIPRPHDSADALAVALAHLQRSRGPRIPGL